jgi:hypothetical protein
MIEYFKEKKKNMRQHMGERGRGEMFGEGPFGEGF